MSGPGRNDRRPVPEPRPALPAVSRSGANRFQRPIRYLDRVAATRLSFFSAIPALTRRRPVRNLKDAPRTVAGAAPAGCGLAGVVRGAYASIALVAEFVGQALRQRVLVYTGSSSGLGLFGFAAMNWVSA